MKTGTLKTTIGNPDTYFRKNNGRYIFVAYTAQQDQIYSKLKEDIEKCLDETKTGLPASEIDEIICCHTSSNLKAGDDAKLNKMCTDKGIMLQIYGVDQIAQEVCNKYPHLAKEFLNISLDTDQILDIEDFIAEYDSNPMAAPLETSIVGRKEELKSIHNLIENNKVVIVYGHAGVGKTRFVLEALQEYKECDACQVLCIKNKNREVYEDLKAYVNLTGSYLVFVDDANEFSHIPDLADYVNAGRDDFDFKLILTVRDYARAQVILAVQKFDEPELFELNSFTDDDVTSFLDKNMEIRNRAYVDQICKISAGNLRIAYMAGALAKANQSLESISDVSQLFERYYAEYLDDKIGMDIVLCKVAGIISLVKSVRIDRFEFLKELFEKVGIEESEFVENINKLHAAEIVDIQADTVVTVSDQCFANYMIYYTFFTKKHISLADILDIGFRHFRNGLIGSVNMLGSIFRTKDSLQYLEDEINVVWDKYSKNKDTSYNATKDYRDFVRCFHIIRPEETLLIVKQIIEEYPAEDYEPIKIRFSDNVYRHEDDVFRLLDGYGDRTLLPTAIELGSLYAVKSRENMILYSKWLQNNYGVEPNALQDGYYNVKTVSSTLAKHLNSEAEVQLFLQFAVYGLDCTFRPTEFKNGNTFVTYNINLTLDDNVKLYRETLWNGLISLSSEDLYFPLLCRCLSDYAQKMINVI